MRVYQLVCLAGICSNWQLKTLGSKKFTQEAQKYGFVSEKYEYKNSIQELNYKIYIKVTKKCSPSIIVSTSTFEDELLPQTEVA